MAEKLPMRHHFSFEKFGFALKILYLCSMINRCCMLRLLIDIVEGCKKAVTDDSSDSSFLKPLAYRARIRGTRRVYDF